MILTETEIRPDHLMDEEARRFANDTSRMNEHKSNFISVPCPACGSDDSQKRFEKSELTYVDCRACGTMYINPRPTPKILEWYYKNSETYQFWSEHIFPASEDARREKIFKPRAKRLIDICTRHDVPTGTLVEVGAGFGTFNEEVLKLNVFNRVVAIEPTPDLAKICRSKTLEVIELPIERVDLEKSQVDVIASFEVIEHLFDPDQFIERCASILSPGGLLVLSCPNVFGFEIQVLQEASDSVDVEHLNYFHPKSLSKLIEDKGMKVIEIQTPGELDAELVRKKTLSKKFDLTGQSFLKHILIDEWATFGQDFQKFLIDKGLSSHMWIVAQKKK